MNADCALRELLDKTRLDLAGGANGSYTAYEKGRIAEKRKWIHDLESILAAPPEAPAGMVLVPSPKAVPYGSESGERDYAYGYEKGSADGWNACRAAMLNAARAAGGGG